MVSRCATSDRAFAGAMAPRSAVSSSAPCAGKPLPTGRLPPSPRDDERKTSIASISIASSSGRAARPERNGQRARAFTFDAQAGRYAVILESTGECVRVRSDVDASEFPWFRARRRFYEVCP